MTTGNQATECSPVVERIDGYGTYRAYCPSHDWYGRRYRHENDARWAVERHKAKASTSRGVNNGE